MARSYGRLGFGVLRWMESFKGLARGGGGGTGWVQGTSPENSENHKAVLIKMLSEKLVCRCIHLMPQSTSPSLQVGFSTTLLSL